MKAALVINCYININPGKTHGFDHPTSLEFFESEATLPVTLDTIRKAVLPEDFRLTLYVFGIAVDRSCDRDNEIRESLDRELQLTDLDYHLYTNTDIARMCLLATPEAKPFFSVAGYPEIRNLGFILPLQNGEDVIIQLDDDELVHPHYFVKTFELLKQHPDKALFTAPYMKNGTVRIKTADDLESWPKFSSMDKDMARLEKAAEPVETLFGFGGNMIVRSSFARRVYYPLGVPRGEDFSMLLASRLLYANGSSSEKAGLVAWFVSLPELTIDHRPPAEAKSDFLFYLEKNLRRFILEWYMLNSQDKLNAAELEPLSSYQHAMLGDDNYGSKIEEIYAELESQTVSGMRGDLNLPALIQSRDRMLAFYRARSSDPPRFPEYLRLRKHWMSLFTMK